MVSRRLTVKHAVVGHAINVTEIQARHSSLPWQKPDCEARRFILRDMTIRLRKGKASRGPLRKNDRLPLLVGPIAFLGI
jgi:hypothetical protein